MQRETQRPPVMAMDWDNLLFLHWPVPAASLQPLIPAGLEIDTFEGQAYIALVPFTMPRVRHRGLPALPGMGAFHECNVRTYVRHGEEAGVWFFSLDAASRLAVWGARWRFHLPYFHADIELQREDRRSTYSVRRRRGEARCRCVWEAGKQRPPAAPGSLEHFLTERYALFAADRQGRISLGRVAHQPWSLQDAELLELEDSLIAAAGVQVPDTPPLAWHAEHLATRAWNLAPVTGG